MSNVFVSYSHFDELLLNEFFPFKRALERDGLVKVWTDKNIKPGEEWRSEIKSAISAANTAILFISQSFLVSEFIINDELPPLLNAHLNRGLTILPVFVSPFDEEAAKIPFKHQKTKKEENIDLAAFQGYGSPDQTLESMTPLERKNIFRELNRRIRELSAQRPLDPPNPLPPIIDILPGLRMLPVPGGVFTMGEDRLDWTNPRHQVQLSPFYLAETPVTNDLYRRFLEENRTYRKPESWGNERFSHDMQPVVGVDWNDAIKFCEWLSESTGKEFSLPTDAQWEFAARGTDARQFPWGNYGPTVEHACFGLDEKTGKPALVGQYPLGQGPFGHLDLSGNTWEWCRDVWDKAAFRKRASSLVKDPLVTEGDGNMHLVRGGSWLLPMDIFQFTCCGGFPMSNRGVGLGFRLAAPASFGS
ncbi:MAG: SUMF1/EgtB/PvdO family nonheme iron enzyme [Magnetococcales bacterium]|nr:SUMF1/EgtB/PvdO family nonheme iron enzyme [Magnetococcales bacterium]MBF0149755.1 SUMF1/EgtB/PvdO family nonheme iron enzyme [Magnetococcales bacterium]MBF0632045.1 SUMF1/EgtB/PvdO family nonheme iron enzyme [Magnetococcales bacterium]